MNILITGGAGYIGSIVSKMLLDYENNIFVIDDLRDGNIKAVKDKITFYKANFGDENLLRDIFKNNNIDIVFHFAASANVPLSKINPLEYYENNVVNTIRLLSVMKEFGILKIIFSSTAAVYGEPKYTPIDENHPVVPINPYGASKLMTEEIIKDCAYAHNLKYIIFRYFCAAGATKVNGESRKSETHLIPLILDKYLGKKKDFYVYGLDFPTRDKSGIRDYVHVEDIAYAHYLGMKTIDDNPNQIYNIGTGTGYSVKEVIDIANNIFNTNIKYKLAGRRDGDPAVLVASFDKAEKYLNWKPWKDIKEIIMSSYKWRENPLY